MKRKLLAGMLMVSLIVPLAVFAQEGGGGGTAPDTSDESYSAESDISEEAPPLEPRIEIRRLESIDGLYSLELRDAQLVDFFRLFAHDYDFNVLVDERVSGTITASFTNVTLDEALKSIATMYGLRLERTGKVIMVKPDLITKAILLKHVDASLLTSGKASTSLGTKAGSDSGAASGSADLSSGAESSTIYDLLSDDGKILLGQQRNMLMVIDYPEYVEKVVAFCEAIDSRMSTKVFKLRYISSKNLVNGTMNEEAEYLLESLGSGN